MNIADLLGLSLTAIALCGCSSAPQAIREPPPEDIGLAQVIEAPDGYIGSRVRWGGTIVSMRNDDAQSWLEVLEFELDRYGEPSRGRDSGGRFLARVGRPLDAQAYRPGRDITVAGTVSSTDDTRIGGAPVRYTVVDVTDEQLWEPQYAYRQRPHPRHYYHRSYGYYPFYYRGHHYGRHHGYPFHYRHRHRGHRHRRHW